MIPETQKRPFSPNFQYEAYTILPTVMFSIGPEHDKCDILYRKRWRIKHWIHFCSVVLLENCIKEYRENTKNLHEICKKCLSCRGLG